MSRPPAHSLTLARVKILAYAAATFSLAACASARTAAAPCVARVPEAFSGAVCLDGNFHVVWGGHAAYHLVDAGGGSVRLEVPPALLERAGGAHAFDRRPVRVTGDAAPGPTLRVRALALRSDTASAR